ncbi:bifunctional diaminohydroxyphosphoribosylaminopyrimidine deaminase/5-amino-6-(5-phosphoribosylamino)uracil reductase RibD [Terriglobus albidus]|uniref:bifunctional diaminohydroxyphosphoribosylaminopyrimidine deaminase/5-amino-6-(5-phosphoribosylamino)uracil reductase RibD n=1 Tax=Terriglobus albidus TaxID=1592106 RepID=UPI0021E0C2C9|nr:bifunctional diaminohydroxyphosphoribosylaminopyrimidine deaminase/5-amino-6-(5-phosphoribosylamino)uracil reductase RibD [Terriglobus albidus]
MELTDDIRYMQQALALAREGVGLASPNPTVGCVLVKNGQVIGRGFHMYEHRDHAEIVALKEARGEAEGATAYVTLEPCSHHGRTGPCADALIHARVGRVVAATVDPNPQVAGQGLARLAQAGIQVTAGVLQEEARELNNAFAKWIVTGSPYVVLKAALSVDGYLAPPPQTRHTQAPHWLTGAAARAHVQQMRHAADAILTGIGTVLADDPLLTDRTNLPRRRKLLRVILDTQLRLPLSSKLVTSADDDLLVLCHESAPAANEDALLELGVRVERIQASQQQINLVNALRVLSERQITSVLVEGGSRLNGTFLASDLVDEVDLFYAEAELGHGAVPFAEGGPSPCLLEQRLSRLSKTEFGSDTLVTGYLRDPWAS